MSMSESTADNGVYETESALRAAEDFRSSLRQLRRVIEHRYTRGSIIDRLIDDLVIVERDLGQLLRQCERGEIL